MLANVSRTHVWLHCVTRSDWWISNYSSSDSQSESRTQLSSEVKCKFLTSGRREEVVGLQRLNIGNTEQ